MLRWFDKNPDRYWWLAVLCLNAAAFARNNLLGGRSALPAVYPHPPAKEAMPPAIDRACQRRVLYDLPGLP